MPYPLTKADLELVVREYANRLPHEYRTILSQRHSTTPIKVKQKAQSSENGGELKNLDEAGYCRLLIELSLLDATYNSYSPDGAERIEVIAKRYRVKVSKIAESVAAEFATRRKKQDERKNARATKRLASPKVARKQQ